LVRGESRPETGSFDMPSNLAVAYVAQELSESDDAAIEFVWMATQNCAALNAKSPSMKRATWHASGGTLHTLCRHRRYERAVAPPTTDGFGFQHR